MDLNEKIEARRHERAKEAQETQRIANEKIDAEKKLAKAIEKAEREKAKEIEEAEENATRVAAAQKIESMGLKEIPEIKPHLNELKIELQVQKIIEKAASARITTGEKAVFAILSAIGLATLFMYWPIGVAFLVWAFRHRFKIIKRHTAEIISEGEKQKQTELIGTIANPASTLSQVDGQNYKCILEADTQP